MSRDLRVGSRGFSTQRPLSGLPGPRRAHGRRSHVGPSVRMRTYDAKGFTAVVEGVWCFCASVSALVAHAVRDFVRFWFQSCCFDTRAVGQFAFRTVWMSSPTTVRRELCRFRPEAQRAVRLGGLFSWHCPLHLSVQDKLSTSFATVLPTGRHGMGCGMRKLLRCFFWAPPFYILLRLASRGTG